MTSLFDNYLLSQPNKPREAGIFWVTDLVKPCLRQAYLARANRDGGGAVDRCFTVQRDPAIFAATVSRARELSQHINAETIPDASSPDWYCDYCSHREGCGGAS